MCNCAVIFDQDCQGENHEDTMRRIRTSMFDYMTCKMIETYEGWDNE